ncbi:MAG: helix-turn-helix transcriptional regulator, partial [Anaerolineales bacterium]
MTNSNFIDWLRKELEERGWSQAELARQSKLSPAQITRLLNGERGIGETGLNAIARALRLPPETVFRAAGMLPNRATDPQA